MNLCNGAQLSVVQAEACVKYYIESLFNGCELSVADARFASPCRAFD